MYVCFLKCGELLSRVSAGGQWRRWGLFLRPTGRAHLWQENQRLVVSVVRNTRLSDAVAPQPPQSSLLPFLLGSHTEHRTVVLGLDVFLFWVRLLFLTGSVFVPVPVRAGRFSHSCAKVRCQLRSALFCPPH